MHKNNSVHLKATKHSTHFISLLIPFGFDHVCTIRYWHWYRVNSCQQQLSHKKLFWWHHLTLSVTSPQRCTSSPPALRAPRSLQVAQGKAGLIAKRSIHNLFHVPEPCSQNATFTTENKVYVITWTNPKNHPPVSGILFILKESSLSTYRNDCSLFSSKCFLQ